MSRCCCEQTSTLRPLASRFIRGPRTWLHRLLAGPKPTFRWKSCASTALHCATAAAAATATTVCRTSPVPRNCVFGQSERDECCTRTYVVCACLANRSLDSGIVLTELEIANRVQAKSLGTGSRSQQFAVQIPVGIAHVYNFGNDFSDQVVTRWLVCFDGS